MTDMTLSDLSAELRMYAGRPEGIHVDNSAFAVWADAIDAHLAKAAQPVEAVPAAWRYVTPVGKWISRGLDEADFRIASEKGYEIQSRYEPAKSIEGVEDIRKAVEQAVIDHCNGSDLWLSTYLAAQCIAADIAHPRPTVPEGYRLVPVEPTDDMCRNAREKIGIGSNVAHHVWHWMIAAAPDGEVE